MPDKLQFVAGFRHSSTAESPDKLKFVGHFWIRQQYPAHRKLTNSCAPGQNMNNFKKDVSASTSRSLLSPFPLTPPSRDASSRSAPGPPPLRQETCDV